MSDTVEYVGYILLMLPQTLIDKSISNVHFDKGRVAREADFTATCEPIVKKM
jgi:hypothetical protein